MTIDEYIAAVAATHHAAFARREVGGRVDRTALRRRAKAGAIVAMSPNVFRVAAAPCTDEQRAVAATLDVGRSIVSGLAGAWLWEIPGFALQTVEVSAPRTSDHRSELAVVRHPRLWLPEQVTVRRGIPVMSLAWTIHDLAGRIPRARLLWIVDRVGNQCPAVLHQMHDLLPILAESGRNGITDMRWALERNPPGIRPPGSGYERRFWDIMEGARITGLRRQVDLGGHEWVGRVDVVCEETRVIFEIDSETHHTSPADVAADRARDEAMLAAGFPEVVRIWTELLWPHPEQVVSIVTRARRRNRSAA